MNRRTRAVRRGLTYSSTDSRLLWSTDGRYIDKSGEQLLGYNVKLDPSMPDIGSNAYPVALADWKQAYVIVDRWGLRVLRDAVTAKPFALFYCTRRSGGAVQDSNALKLLKCA